jgi:hypothetical protein
MKMTTEHELFNDRLHQLVMDNLRTCQNEKLPLETAIKTTSNCLLSILAFLAHQSNLDEEGFVSLCRLSWQLTLEKHHDDRH